MHVFVAGATGILGRCLVPELVRRGHTVRGIARSDEKAAALRSYGAEAVYADLYDVDAMARAAEGCEAVLHMATSIPNKVRTTAADWAENDRLRTDGVRSLTEGARKAGARLYVQQSVTFVHGDMGGAWVDETTPPKPTPGIRSALEAERIALGAPGLSSVVLRGGWFVHAESATTKQMIADLRAGRYPIVGSGDNWLALVHVADYASAVAQAIEHAPPGEVYEIVSDEPATLRQLLEGLAVRVGAGWPWTIPAPLAKAVVGESGVRFVTASVRVRNDKAKRDLAWRPRYPTLAAILDDVVGRAS